MQIDESGQRCGGSVPILGARNERKRRLGDAGQLLRRLRDGSTPRPAGDGEIAENERLPPRQLRTKLRWLAASNPNPDWQRDATVVKCGNPRLPPLPTDTDQDVPAPRGPAGMSGVSHHQFLRHTRHGSWDAGQT